MTIWAGVAIFYGAVALIETVAALIGAGIPLLREKIREKRRQADE